METLQLQSAARQPFLSLCIRFTTSSAVIPCSRTILCRDVCPRTSSTLFRAQPNLSAKKRTNASFAAESTGGAVTFTRNSFPSASPISFAEARGCSLIANQTPSGWERK
jgi:hypothetical protein